MAKKKKKWSLGKSIRNPLSKKSQINPFSKKSLAGRIARPLGKDNPINPFSKTSRFNPAVPVRQTVRAFKTNKDLRKGALVVGTAVAAFYTGGASLAIQQKIAAAQAAKKRAAAEARAQSGMDAYVDKFYGGATGAELSPDADAGYTANNAGGGDGVGDEQSAVSSSFYRGVGIRRGDFSVPAGRGVVGTGMAGATAASCSAPAMSSIDPTPILFDGEIYALIGYVLVLCMPFVIVWAHDRWERRRGNVR